MKMTQLKHLLCILLLLAVTPVLHGQNPGELRSFADKFSEAVVDDNTAYLKTALHKPTFTDRILIRGKSEGIRGFNEGFSGALNKDFLLGKIIMANFTSGFGSYDVVRVYFDGDDPHAIFRLTDGEIFDYHDLLLRKFNGVYKIIDIYSYVAGEYATETFQRLYLTIASDLFSKARTADLPDINMGEMLKVGSIKLLADQGLYQDAAEQIKNLNPETRKEKMVRLIELLIMANLGDKQYLKALSEYHESFPNDPSLYMTSVDYLILLGEFKAAQDAINKLDKMLGGDSFLNLMRGNAYFEQGDFKNATEKFKSVTDNHPMLVQGWDGLASSYVGLKRYSEAVTALNGILDNLLMIDAETLAETIEEDSFYDSFIKSMEYKNWKKEN